MFDDVEKIVFHKKDGTEMCFELASTTDPAPVTDAPADAAPADAA